MSLVKSCFTHKLIRKQQNKCAFCGEPLEANSSNIICKYDESLLISAAKGHDNLYWAYEQYWEDWLFAIHAHCYAQAQDVLCIGEVTDSIKRNIDKILQNLTTSLGVKTSSYEDTYNKDLLVPIPRSLARDDIGYETIFFSGIDVWNAWEVSYLNKYGKPVTCQLQIGYDSNSTNIIESKSFKLYLNSFNNTRLDEDITQIIKRDIEEAANAHTVYVDYIESYPQKEKEGYKNIDETYVLPSHTFTYEYEPELLEIKPVDNSEIGSPIKLFSSLLKSNCRHSGLPDWAEVYLSYVPSNAVLNQEAFLKYLISFRNHKEFHEECCERIFYDLVSILNPLYIRLELNYTRRGGLDINPIRVHDITGASNFSFNKEFSNFRRTFRQ